MKKINISRKSAILLSSLGLIIGIAGTIALQSQAANNIAAATTETTTAASPTTDKDVPRGHAPLGGDGNITAINGTTVTMQEESNEGGASYTVDASKATVTNNGAAADLSALKVGDKIFVQGTTNGTNVTATSLSLGRGMKGGHAPLGGDGNIVSISDTTIIMQEEADEGGATYTVDASNATVTNNGTTADISALKVGDKIFVQGTTNGTNVTATSISLGHMSGRY